MLCQWLHTYIRYYGTRGVRNLLAYPPFPCLVLPQLHVVDAGVAGIVGDDENPLEDEAKVGHEGAPEHDDEAHEHRDEDETKHDDGADELREIGAKSSGSMANSI